MQKFSVILFYKYVKIADPKKLMGEQKVLCMQLNLKGRMIIAREGINGTFEGRSKDINKYIDTLGADLRFRDIHFKRSEGDGDSFPRLSVKVRDEIVAGKLKGFNVDPSEQSGKYITPKQLHRWFLTKKEFYIVDMRNDYEQEVGMFEGSVKSGMHWFWDLPETAKKVEHLSDKTVVTVCTGGVRCEKASGFLIKNGFSDVYQLQGGIHSYIEQYPNEKFKGSLYVFDRRVVMSFDYSQDKSFNMGDLKHEIIGRCAKCNKPSEKFINCLDSFCDRQFIVCADCTSGEKILCPMGCRDYAKEHPEKGIGKLY